MGKKSESGGRTVRATRGHGVPGRPLAAHKTPQDPPKTCLGRGQDAQEPPQDALRHAPDALGTAQAQDVPRHSQKGHKMRPRGFKRHGDAPKTV